MPALHNVLILLSSILFMVSGFIYALDVKHSRIKPNIASFLIWSLANTSLLVSLIVAHIWTTVPFVAIAAATSILISILSMKSGKFYISALDIVVLALGVMGVAAWMVTSQAAWNVYIVCVIDVVCWTAIIAKSLKFPHLEAKLAWRLNFIGSALLALSIPSWEIVQWIIPVVQIFFSGLLNAVLLKGSLAAAGNRR